MRPRSIAGPLLLIGVGALFLVANWQPDLSPIRLFAEYWPFLLVAWGALRAIEILAWYFQSKVLPREGISGGEWALAVMLSIAGAGVYLFQTHMTAERLEQFSIRGVELFGEAHEFPLEPGSISAESPNPVIVIENLYGAVSVTGSPGKEVSFTGTKTIRAMREEVAEKNRDETPVELTAADGRITLRTNLERSSRAQSRTDLEVRVPSGAALEIRARSGECRIAGLQGPVTVRADRMEAEMERIGGDVRLETRSSGRIDLKEIKGNVVITGRGEDLSLERIAGQVRVDGSFSGDVRLSEVARPVQFRTSRTDFEVNAVPGEIRFDLGDLHANGITGPLRLNSRSKDIRVESVSGPVHLTIETGDVHLLLSPGPAVHPVDVKVRSGRVEVGVPPGSDYNLRADVVRGKVENRTGREVRIEEHRRGASLTGTGSGATLTVHVERGSFDLVEDSSLPPPPPPPGWKEGPPAAPAPPAVPQPPKPQDL